MEAIRQVLVINGRDCHKSEPLFKCLINKGIDIQFRRIENVYIADNVSAVTPKILLTDQHTCPTAIKQCLAQFEAINLLLVEPHVLVERPEFYQIAIEIGLLPYHPDELLIRLERSMALLHQDSSSTAVSSNDQGLHKNLIGNSPEFLTVVERIQRYINIDAPVLITGETGTGKEMVARALHYSSARKSMPFQALNCGALPDNLLESELFGHAKGAFTDAKESFEGLIAMAEGGTLFLDEIDSLSFKAQTALLRFLQDGQYRSVGGSKSRASNVRIVSATNNHLEQLADQKLFRRDLIFRLNTLPLHLPPLRKRGTDIIVLAEHFLQKCTCEHGKGKKIFHLAVKNKLAEYDWPGNIRELENYVQRAYLLTDQAVIGMLPDSADSIFDSNDTVDEQSSYRSDSRTIVAGLNGGGAGSEGAQGCLDDGENDPFNLPQLNLDVTTGIVDKTAVSIEGAMPEFSVAKKAIVDNFEISYIQQLLRHTGGNVSRAAKLAGKERRVFGRLMKKHQIEKEPFVAS